MCHQAFRISDVLPCCRSGSKAMDYDRACKKFGFFKNPFHVVYGLRERGLKDNEINIPQVFSRMPVEK
jgi:hypothetical protein